MRVVHDGRTSNPVHINCIRCKSVLEVTKADIKRTVNDTGLHSSLIVRSAKMKYGLILPY